MALLTRPVPSHHAAGGPNPRRRARRRAAARIAGALAGMLTPVAGAVFEAPPAQAFAGDVMWTDVFGGVTSDDTADVAVDASHNTYVVGTFWGTMPVGAGNLVTNGQSDAFVVKLTSGGGVSWARKIGGTAFDRALGVDVDASGNVFVAATLKGPAAFAGQPVAADANGDPVVVKFNSSGTEQWARTVAIPADGSYGQDLDVSPSGDVTLVGTFSGTAGAGGTALTSAGGKDAFAVRWTGAGAQEWAKRFGGTGDDAVEAVAGDGVTEATFLAGTYDGGTTSFGGHPVPAAADRNAIAIRIGATGLVDYAAPIVGAVGSSVLVFSLAVHPFNGAVVGGSFSDGLTVGESVLPGGTAMSAFTAFVSSAGVPVRAIAHDGSGSEAVTAMAWDEAGNLGQSIRFTSSIDLGGGPFTASGPNDTLLRVMDPSGATLWQDRATGAGSENVTGLAIGADGHLRFVGESDDANVAGTPLATQGQDGWVVAVEDPVGESTYFRYKPITPTRVLDTREGLGLTGGPSGPGSIRHVKVANTLGVPSGTAVAVNLTVTQPSAATHLSVWPTGQPKTATSSINVSAGQTAANLLVVRMGTNYQLSFFNNAGTAHVIMDVVGVYVNNDVDNRYTAVPAKRVIDTRDGTGGGNGPFNGGTVRAFKVAGVAGTSVPATATAVVLNTTIAGPSAATHLTVWPNGAPQPTASSINVAAGETRANLVIAKVSATGFVSIRNNAGTAHVIGDVVGYYATTAATEMMTLAPSRILDTRNGIGGFSGKIANSSVNNVTVSGVGGVPPTASTVVVNVTVTGGTAGSHLTLWPQGAAMPASSTLNFAAGATVPNLAIVPIGTNGQIRVANNAGSVHVILDVVGYY